MWSLLSITKRLCLRIWLGFFAVLLTITLVQTITGAVAKMTVVAWSWLLLTTLPGLLFLMIAVMRDRQSARVIPRFNHRTLIWSTAAYLSLVLLTLLAEEWATREELSMVEYRNQSFLWLAPLEVLLLTGYAISLWSKNTNFLSRQHDIGEVAEKEAELWAERHNSFREKAFEHIKKGEIGTAISLTVAHIEQTDIGDLNEGIHLQSRYQEHQRNKRMNIITNEHAETERNKITLALMELIRRA